MLQLVRQMPPGVLVFLGYAFLILAFLGLTLPLAGILLFSPAGLVGAMLAVAVLVLVLWSLRRPRSRAWFVEP